MASFPTFAFNREFVKVRFLEPSVPESLNQRWLGMPRGVYLGFEPQVTAGSDTLTLGVDPNHNFSKLAVGSQSRRMQVDIFTGSAVELNFTGHIVWPTYVIARGDYQDGVATQARIITRATTASGPQEVLICKVDKVNGDLSVEADFTTGTKQPPLAGEGQQIGFMAEGSVDDITLGNSILAELVQSRISAYTGLHSDLSTRIEADLVGSSMADRLGLRLSFLVGNLVLGVSGNSANVSGSFAETNREFEPKLTVEPEADETTEGAITGPNDATRNVCFVVDGGNGERIVDSSDQEPVFGRLTYATSNVVGTINFFNGTTTVTGIGSPFTSIQEGDIVRAVSPPGDDEWYEIASVIDGNNAELGAAFQGGTPGGPAVAVLNPPYRRFTLVFFTVASGTVSVTASSLRFVFPCFYRADRSIYDGWLFLKKDGELPAVPDATESVSGKGLLAITDGKVGALRSIENNGSVIGNDFHTLNFIYDGATNLGLGVAEVSVVGAQGAPGTNSNVGPTGPIGDPGYGFSACQSFVPSIFSAPAGVASISFSHDFSTTAPSIGNIRHLYGGLAALEGWAANWEFKITNISTTSPSTGLINASISGPGGHPIRFKVWLGACE